MKENSLFPKDTLNDSVHPNKLGNFLIAELIPEPIALTQHKLCVFQTKCKPGQYNQQGDGSDEQWI